MKPPVKKYMMAIVPSRSEEIQRIRDLVEDVATDVGFDAHQRYFIVLAVNEAIANVIEHAYKGDKTGKIRVDLRGGKTKIDVRIRDWGATPDPDVLRAQEPGQERDGGYGIHIMQNVMDKVQYATKAGGGTELHMVKFLKTNGKSERTKTLV